MTCHHIPTVRCPECVDNRPSMGYWPVVESDQLATLREENATLRAGLEATANHRAKTERELDDVRAEVARLKDELLDRNGHVLRLTRSRDIARHEAIAARHELRVAQADLERQIKETEKVWAEVARLEGLILLLAPLSEEARRIRAQREGKCPECEGTGATGAGVPCCIRAQREEGR